MIELNNYQIRKLYKVFDFEPYETIMNATMECEKGGQMDIEYLDERDGSVGHYQPYLAKHGVEDREKVDYILNGVIVEREN